MAKKPSKKPSKKTAKKKAPAPKKKPSVKAAAKKVVKKVVAKPAAVKKPAPVAKKRVASPPKKAMVKAAVPAKKVEVKKAVEPMVKAAKAVKAKAPTPVKTAEKLAKKATPKSAPKVAEIEIPIVPEVEEESEEMVLTDAEGRRFCRVRDCDQLSVVDTYCRFHYLLHWKKIQVRKKILTEGKLERYIEELTARYPDKFLDMLRKDLRSEKEFLGAIQELEIDESAMENDLEEEAQTYIDEVRGMEPTARETEEDF